MSANVARPLVSCLMATRGRPGLMQRAVACFLHQTYAPCELIVVHHAEDDDTPKYFDAIDNPRIKVFRAPANAKLGALRNLTVDKASGSYLATWDDDDWSAPRRVADQMRALENSAMVACVLSRVTVIDSTTDQVFISKRRHWEPTMLVRKDALPRYEHYLSFGEDRRVVERLRKFNAVAHIERPDLYYYVYHGGNTCDATHWQTRIFPNCQPVDTSLADDVLSNLRLSA